MAFSASNSATVDPVWAWAGHEPSSQEPWDQVKAAHLLRRAGFAPTWAELQAATSAGPAATVDQLLLGGAESVAYYEQAEKTLSSLLGLGGLNHLPAWWLNTMTESPHPLLEKMTLFWHGHFATSAIKVNNATMMARQHRLLRAHALGNFRPLLTGAAKDPAMLVWLDSATNHKARPNENFAREVMELFSLGIGNYSETDIKQAARAFTGWEVRREHFWFNQGQYDKGNKSLLGKTGNFAGEDVVDILLEQPAAARFIVQKLFRFFVSDTTDPSPELLEPLAAGFRDHDYDISWPLRTILSSNYFYSAHALHQKVKSPVELGVGLVRCLEATTNSYALAEALRDLGQGVFMPPNVKGWDGGVEWINSSRLLGRANLVWALVSGQDERYKRKIALDTLVARHVPQPVTTASTTRWLADLLLASPLPEAVQVQLAALAADGSAQSDHQRYARVVHAIATLPEFQLV